uniref:Uncharacterized protein n=1 Tax=Candidatus Kentrum sp. UNK TaxID=2126344 RepID=A0A451AHF3_9GAMM|nr:MAG: hypothetical protein BECKUNK1418G_GA0071005_106316 [Candidatus Kentron sp. UNK]VFK72414.1 MAG: hypothetical protein BECKUNK1418H_GA0071006_111310 [Candidatus Kentron sp. UNK]
MTIQTALLPHKHVRFSESIIALAGLVRKILVEPRTIDELWSDVTRSSTQWPSEPSFTHLVLAVDVLFAIGQIEAAPGGRIRRNSQLGMTETENVPRKFSRHFIQDVDDERSR